MVAATTWQHLRQEKTRELPEAGDSDSNQHQRRPSSGQQDCGTSGEVE